MIALMSSEEVRDPQQPPLRVLHILSSISPKNGGPVQSLWFLLRASAMRGFKTSVATTNEDGPGGRLDVSFDHPVHIEKSDVHYFPCQTNFYSASAPLLRWLWSNIRRYDVVHVHALFSFAPVVAAYCARMHGIPYVISPHGVLNRWGRSNRRPFLKRASIRLVEAPLLRGAATVQFSSRQELEEFDALSISVRSHVIPHPMPEAAPTTDARFFEAGAALDALHGRPAVLFLARIHPIKGLDLLLRAFVGVVQSHPATVLLIAGDGEPTLVAGLRALADELGVAENVQWVGFVAGPLKNWLLERATLFVLPSWSENFGLAVAEAMAAGVPVIVTKGVGIADIVATGHCGLVTDCEVPALQRAMESLLGDEVARSRMGQAGRRIVREQLSMEAYSRQLDEMYRDALGGVAVR